MMSLPNCRRGFASRPICGRSSASCGSSNTLYPIIVLNWQTNAWPNYCGASTANRKPTVTPDFHNAPSPTSDPAVRCSALLSRVLRLEPGRIVYRELHGPRYRTYGEVTRLSESGRFVWVLWDGNKEATRELRRRFSTWY